MLPTLIAPKRGLEGARYQAIKRLRMLQGTMKPQQIISLFDIGGPTIKMADHADHLHIGYPAAGREGPGGVRGAVIKRRDWFKLIDRLGEIDNPAVGKKPSKYALPSRASRSHRGD